MIPGRNSEIRKLRVFGQEVKTMDTGAQKKFGEIPIFLVQYATKIRRSFARIFWEMALFLLKTSNITTYCKDKWNFFGKQNTIQCHCDRWFQPKGDTCSERGTTKCKKLPPPGPKKKGLVGAHRFSFYEVPNTQSLKAPNGRRKANGKSGVSKETVECNFGSKEGKRRSGSEFWLNFDSLIGEISC